MIIELGNGVIPFCSKLQHLSILVLITFTEFALLERLEVVDVPFIIFKRSHRFLLVRHRLELRHLIIIDVLDVVLSLALLIMIAAHGSVLQGRLRLFILLIRWLLPLLLLLLLLVLHNAALDAVTNFVASKNKTIEN